MSGQQHLWAVEHTPPGITNERTLSDALRVHIAQRNGTLTSMVVQIGDHQKTYVQLSGCDRCRQERCVPGCRTALFRRILKSGLPNTTLRLVSGGLMPRPYTRWYGAWPTATAEPLDGHLLHSWQDDARLTLQWNQRQWPAQGVSVHAVLAVGATGPDPRPILEAKGWRVFNLTHVHKLFLVPGDVLSRFSLSLASERCAPTILLPVQASDRNIEMEVHKPVGASPEDRVTSQRHATLMARHLETAGARIEFLDLHPDTWTGTVAATSQDGGDATAIIQDATAPGGMLQLCDLTTQTVALDRAQPIAPNALPPVLSLGQRPNGLSRWRPMSNTHHLMVTGPHLPGIISGLIEPLVDGRSDVHIGILDVADGTLARPLAQIPNRLPTVRYDDVQELLGALGTIEDSKAPALVVVYAEETAACEAAITPLLRATAYLYLSIIIAMPSEDSLPEMIKARIPLICVRGNQGLWEAPYGDWRWAQPTVLRLPWRDPAQAWRGAPRLHQDPDPGALTLDQFWVIPDSLRYVLLGEEAASFEEGDGQAIDQSEQAIDSTNNHGSNSTAVQSGVSVDQDTDVHTTDQPIRFDQHGLLIVDDRLIAYVLRWAEENDQGEGASFRKLQTGLGLPNKLATERLMQALYECSFIAEQLPRQGWFRLMTLSQAISQGQLADGPWAHAYDQDMQSPAEAHEPDLLVATSDDGEILGLAATETVSSAEPVVVSQSIDETGREPHV
jgi:hypothetical protein